MNLICYVEMNINRKYYFVGNMFYDETLMYTCKRKRVQNKTSDP